MINKIFNNYFLKRVYRVGAKTVQFISNPEANLASVDEGLEPHTQNIDESYEIQVLNRIIKAYRSAKKVQAAVPAPYQIGGEWQYILNSKRKEYIDASMNGDIELLRGLLRNFFRNNGTHGLMTWFYYEQISRFGIFGKMGYANLILYDIATWKSHVNKPVSTLAQPYIGNPWGYILDNMLFLSDAPRHNYDANKTLLLLDDVSQPVVAEIGGGYGGYAYYLLHNPIHYLNFDIPEILMIHQYYLMNAYPNKRFLLYNESENRTISHHDIMNYDAILMPNFMLPRLESETVDLFYNSSSLCEMDYSTIQEYISNISRNCKGYFFHENSDEITAKSGTFKETPGSRFPIRSDEFKLLSKTKSLWAGGEPNRYKEFLYQKRKNTLL